LYWPVVQDTLEKCSLIILVRGQKRSSFLAGKFNQLKEIAGMKSGMVRQRVAWTNVLEEADLLVNLCGKNVKLQVHNRKPGGDHPFPCRANKAVGQGNRIIKYTSKSLDQSGLGHHLPAC
jgi:hypothetical protein